MIKASLSNLISFGFGLLQLPIYITKHHRLFLGLFTCEFLYLEVFSLVIWNHHTTSLFKGKSVDGVCREHPHTPKSHPFHYLVWSFAFTSCCTVVLQHPSITNTSAYRLMLGTPYQAKKTDMYILKMFESSKKLLKLSVVRDKQWRSLHQCMLLKQSLVCTR